MTIELIYRCFYYGDQNNDLMVIYLVYDLIMNHRIIDGVKRL